MEKSIKIKFFQPSYAQWDHFGNILLSVKFWWEQNWNFTLFEGWPSGLRRCNKNQKVPGSNPPRHSARLRDPTSLWGSRWPSGQKCKTQWLTSGEWGCPLDNDPKLAVRQPNSSLKKKKKIHTLASWPKTEKFHRSSYAQWDYFGNAILAVKFR